MTRFLKEALITSLSYTQWNKVDKDENEFLKKIVQKNIGKLDSDNKVIQTLLSNKILSQLTPSLKCRLSCYIIKSLPFSFKYDLEVQNKLFDFLVGGRITYDVESNIVANKHITIDNLIKLAYNNTLICSYLKQSKDPAAIAYFKLNQL